MNSKYSEYLPLIQEIHRNNPDWKSDVVAAEVVRRFPDRDINVSSLGRLIRGQGWLNTGTKNNNPAKVLLFDVETLPYELKVRVWSLWNQNLKADDIVKEFSLISWAAKWLFDDEVHSMKCTRKEALARDDKRIMEGLHRLLDEANVVIAHNLDKYDNKVFQARCFANGLKLPSPYQRIDTLKVAKTMFGNKLGSNRLDHIATKVLKVAGKQETPRGLWDDCCEGDEEAIRIMDEYCRQDVRVLEDVYLEMRPYIRSHPNIGLHVGSSVQTCSSCGSSHLVWKGSYHTTMNEYETYQCGDCGSWGRSKKSALDKPTRDLLTAPLAR